jgi:NAD(P)-dependent dehydrogenase (short-subunit alcohol dehydrogenase family)
MDLQLTGRSALVTGGSRGIGRAVARRLAEEGCRVAIVSRNRAGVDRAAAALEAETGQPVVALVGDAGDDESVRAVVHAARDRLGGVEILVNSAATSAGAVGPAATVSPDRLRSEIDIKALGYLRFAQAVAPGMIERGWGRIISVAGLAARQTGSLSAAVRNVAVAAMTKTLADELGPYGVNVTAVHPGTTRTERIAEQVAARAQELGSSAGEIAAQMGASYSIGRLVEPDEVAYLVGFLASPLSVAVNGDAIACGGGRLGSIHY